MPDKKHTEIKEMGEFGLINHLTKNFKIRNKSTLKGVGDDCAVIDAGNRKLLVSTDMLVHKVHFDLMYTPVRHLGYKSVIAGISDIYAMNGLAEQIFVSVAISNQFSVELLEELYAGMTTACEKYQIDFAGGDTTTIESGLVINVTATGFASEEDIVYRCGASKNEIICVTGDLGAAFTGLLVLQREKKVFQANSSMQPELDKYPYILRRVLKPEARKDVVGIFHDMGIKPTAMMDISDGLSSELFHICTQSGCGCKIFEEKIPIDPEAFNTARELNMDPVTCALNGGEDYELLFTLKQEDYQKVEKHPDFTAIGHITDPDNGIKLITRSGNEYPLEAQGWQSFKESTE